MMPKKKALEESEVLEEGESLIKRQFPPIKEEEPECLEKKRKNYGIGFLPSLYKKFEAKKSKTLENLNKGKCKEHDRDLELLCMDEKVRICTDCALFGDHKSHAVLSFKEAVIREETSFGMILSSAIRLKGELTDIFEDDGLPSNFYLKLLQICNQKRREMKSHLELKIQVRI